MRGIAIVFIAFLAYSSAYPLEEQQVRFHVPESSLQVEASEQNAVVPDASKIVQIAKDVESKAQQLLNVDAGASANVEGARQARQYGYGGYGGYGGYPGGFGGGYGGFPGGYGGYGGYGGFPGGFGGYGGYGGHRRRGGFWG